MALVNVWHLRKVAETSVKPCDICYKPTPSVLITPDNKDHFYVCAGHLKDRGFASPIVDEAAAAAKKKREELDKEIELVKKEYEEKLKSRKSKQEKKKAAEKDKVKDKSDAEEKKPDGEAADAEQERDQKIQAINNKQTPAPADDDTPRIYALQKVFFQKRLDRIRNAEIAKRNRERLRSPNLFPSVPTGNLG